MSELYHGCVLLLYLLYNSIHQHPPCPPGRPCSSIEDQLHTTTNMLKRQRPMSPLPSVDVPLEVVPDLSHQHHGAKRKRIVAPVLDGEWRGWGRGLRCHEKPCDNEDYEDEEEEYSRKGSDAAKGGEADERLDGLAGIYKSTNSFLHDLHALNQHRLIFSNPPPPSVPSSPPTQHLQSPAQSRPAASRYHDSKLPAKPALTPISELCQRIPAYFPESSKGFEDGMHLGEVQKVKERYEDINRYSIKLIPSF